MALEVFLSHFYKEYNGINESLNGLIRDENVNDNEQKLKLSALYEVISNRMIVLQKYFTDNTSYLPLYEVRKAQEHVNKLNKFAQEKRDQIFPKKKFGFKSKQNMTTLEASIQKAETNAIPTKEAEISANENINLSHSIMIKDVDNSTVIKFGEEINGKDIGILNIKDSTIEILGNPSVIHATNIENSTILVGPISGSAFLNNLKNSKVVISCHQLRIHESTKTQFYTHLGSRAIIENCNNIKFGPYTLTYPDINSHFKMSGLNPEQSNWTCIDDFNWLNQEASPNWCFLEESETQKWNLNEKGDILN